MSEANPATAEQANTLSFGAVLSSCSDMLALGKGTWRHPVGQVSHQLPPDSTGSGLGGDGMNRLDIA